MIFIKKQAEEKTESEKSVNELYKKSEIFYCNKDIETEDGVILEGSYVKVKFFGSTDNGKKSLIQVLSVDDDEQTGITVLSNQSILRCFEPAPEIERQLNSINKYQEKTQKASKIVALCAKLMNIFGLLFLIIGVCVNNPVPTTAFYIISFVLLCCTLLTMISNLFFEEFIKNKVKREKEVIYDQINVEEQEAMKRRNLITSMES